MYRLERTIELPDMIAYAGATWDWHRLHYDADYLAERGLDRPVVDGQVFGAYLAIALGEWFPGSTISELSFRFKSLVFAGETIRCVGTVVPRAPSAPAGRVELDLRVEVVGDGRVAVAPAAATLVLPAVPVETPVAAEAPVSAERPAAAETPVSAETPAVETHVSAGTPTAVETP